MSQSVFVLEDDADISRLVQHHLEAAGFTVRPYLTPTNLIPDAERQPPALFLLDIMVPGGDGLDVCRRLRANAALSTIPIIFLTARAGENDRVLGLELGADDYITKPYSLRETVARVCVLLRSHSQQSDHQALRCDDLVLDASTNRVTAQGKLINLRGVEYRLLEFLMAHSGRTFNRTQLLSRVWGGDTEVDERTVDVNVQRLRKILSERGYEAYIQTVRGFGYRFAPPAMIE